MRERINDSTVICIWFRMHYAIDTGVGIVSVYFLSGFVRTSFKINESAPHFFSNTNRCIRSPHYSTIVITMTDNSHKFSNDALYQAPRVEIIDIQMEHCFASTGNNEDFDDNTMYPGFWY